MPELNLGKVVGPQGPQGAVGPAGAQGIQGPQGVPGEAGKSAYQAAKDGGYTGTEAEFNAIMSIIEKHAGRHKKGGADEITPNMIGAAPAGFGLGKWDVSTLKNITSDASVVDTFKSNGWFGYVDNTGVNLIPDVASNICLIRPEVINSSYCRQTAYNTSGNKLVRVCTGGTWQPWEWENPPMILGEEYRTTERYMGKPVYTKLIDCGLSSSGKKSVNSNLVGVNIIRCSAAIDNRHVSPHIWKDDDSYSVLVDTVKDANTIYVVIFAGANAANLAVRAQVWYYKD